MTSLHRANEEERPVSMTTRLWCCIFSWRNQLETIFLGARLRLIQWMLVFFLMVTLVCFVGTARAGIANTPLFTATQVAPNVFFMLDDSGSMDWTILSKKYWEPCSYDPDSGADVDNSDDCGGVVENGEMRSYGTR